MGGPDSYHSYGSGWANASSTPLNMYKHYGHEGDIRTPLVVHWPKEINRNGEIDHRLGHFVDFMATFVDVAGVKYPENYKGYSILPMEGESMMPAFRGEEPNLRTICFEHEEHCGIHQGKWKLSKIKERDWELYNIDQDRSEQHNLRDKHPEIAEKMIRLWEEWAHRTNVYPRQL